MKKAVNVSRWLFGSVFVIGGITGIIEAKELLLALFIVLLGISLLPITWSVLSSKSAKWMQTVIPMLFFILCVGVSPKSGEANNQLAANNTATKTIATEKITEAITSSITERQTETSSPIETEVQTETKAQTERVTQTETEPFTETETPVTEVLAKGDMVVHFLDVGQGLSILVQSGGQNLVYDGGDKDTSSFVVSYLKTQGITTIDYLLSSHYDSDHVSGLIGCLNAFTVNTIIGSNYVHDSDTYQSFINNVSAKGLSTQYPEVGTEYAFGTGKFTILAPSTIDNDDSNNNSVAIRLENGDNSFIFTGDAESSSESSMCNAGINLESDVLVAGHHGSGTATSWDFLQSTIPKWAIISCGADNQYGHPDKDVMDKFQSMEIPVYRTDKQGTIIAISNGTDITWNQEPCNDYSPGESTDIGTTVSGSGHFYFPDQTEAVSQTEAPVQTGGMVWIPATGEKYHNKPDCGRMNPNTASNVTKEYAISHGYDACKKCY